MAGLPPTASRTLVCARASAAVNAMPSASRNAVAAPNKPRVHTRFTSASAICVLDACPFGVVGDVLELGEVHAVGLVDRPAGLEVGQSPLDGARDAKDQRRRISRHRETQRLQLAWRQHRSL